MILCTFVSRRLALRRSLTYSCGCSEDTVYRFNVLVWTCDATLSYIFVSTRVIGVVVNILGRFSQVATHAHNAKAELGDAVENVPCKQLVAIAPHNKRGVVNSYIIFPFPRHLFYFLHHCGTCSFTPRPLPLHVFDSPSSCDIQGEVVI